MPPLYCQSSESNLAARRLYSARSVLWALITNDIGVSATLIVLATMSNSRLLSSANAPLSYSDWIATHWNIDITDEIRSMVGEAGFLIRGIRDEDQLNQALITVKSL